MLVANEPWWTRMAVESHRARYKAVKRVDKFPLNVYLGRPLLITHPPTFVSLRFHKNSRLSSVTEQSRQLQGMSTIPFACAVFGQIKFTGRHKEIGKQCCCCCADYLYQNIRLARVIVHPGQNQIGIGHLAGLVRES